MDEVKLWRTGVEHDLQPLDTVAQLETELQLEDILTAHPELLETGLQLVGRQTPAAGGWLDLLGVDRYGRLVIYELKRGALGRDAVTQVLDYASALTEMDLDALAEHIAARSGEGGVQQISDFTEWYEGQFSDLQQLLPPRMVLVGLGIDETALRIARFINDGPHDIEVVTFYGFRDGEGTLLARQLPVQRDEPSARRPRRCAPKRRQPAADRHRFRRGPRTSSLLRRLRRLPLRRRRRNQPRRYHRETEQSRLREAGRSRAAQRLAARRQSNRHRKR